jgi:outer membrane protein TolC
VLRIQAREALRSAETAYRTGKLNAVDLLDAEVVLFDVQIATARTRTDLAIAQAELERAVARSLKPSKEGQDHDR